MIRNNLFLFLILSIIGKNIFADINSATITADTLEALPSCVHYEVRGLCYWANYNSVNTTPYIEQYLPDVVVTVFNKPGDNPWLEINDTLDQAGQVAESQIVSSLTDLKTGYGQHSFADIHEQNIFFKEADVIGNPALAVLPQNMGFLPSSCRTLNALLPIDDRCRKLARIATSKNTVSRRSLCNDCRSFSSCRYQFN